MKQSTILRICFIGLLLSLYYVGMASSAPTPGGPYNISVISSSTRGADAPSSISAVAGNVTQLRIYAFSQTQTWQGYYGNVTGSVTLETSQGRSIYHWELTNPSGQIFASTSTVNFAAGNIACYNFSKTAPGYFNLTAYENSLSIPSTAVDGINETFNESVNYDPFYVGITYINTTCPVVYLYNASNQSSRTTYQEVLLYDNSSNRTVFTSLIRPGGIAGFNTQAWDFEMIVAENGRNDDTQPTPYYFYVALE